MGNIPSLILVFITTEAQSSTVPSPPTAITLCGLFSCTFLSRFSLSFLPVVFQISMLSPELWAQLLIVSVIEDLSLSPDIGLITKRVSALIGLVLNNRVVQI